MRHIYRLHIILILLVVSFAARAQSFTNNWVNHNQQYYRIEVPRNGVYRIMRTQLERAGVPIGNITPQNIQLVQNGKLIPCYIDGEAEGLFNYIEFYAQKNNGWFDVEMYNSAKSQANPHHSLIADEGAVFLTWNDSFSNLRLKSLTTTNVDGYKQLDYCIIDTVCQYTNTYLTGETQCGYVEAEGWFDAAVLSLGSSITKSVPTPSVYSQGKLKAKINVVLATYSSNKHHIAIQCPGFSHDTVFTGLRNLKYSVTIDATKLASNNNFTFRSIDDVNAKTDYSRVSYIEIEYPSSFNFSNRRQQQFTLPPSETDACIAFSGIVLGANSVLYDITRGIRIGLMFDGSMAKAIVPKHTMPIEMIVVSETALAKAGAIDKALLSDHSRGNKANVIITHSSLMSSVKKYADYRNAYVADITDICNQFGYGIANHPLAIRKFIEFINSQWSVKPQTLFLIGKGVSAINTRYNKTYAKACLVPPMGYPASDALLSAYVDGSGHVPLLATGRLSAVSNADVEAYLEKVKTYESAAQAEWMKRVIHFCGGSDTYEQRVIKGYMDSYSQIIEDTLFGGKVSTFVKNSSEPIVTSKIDSVYSLINNGVSLITFFGHGSTTTGFDQNIDYPTSYSNEGKYPLLLSNSCYTGEIFSPWQNSISEQWVLPAKCGAIGLIAMVSEGLPSYLNMFTRAFYTSLSKKSYGEPIGKILKEAQENTLMFQTQNTINTIQEMVLHGDPCIVLNSPQQPDLTINNSDVWFTPSVLDTKIDSFTINVAVKNIGKSVTSEFCVMLERVCDNNVVETQVQAMQGLKYCDTIKFRLSIGQNMGGKTNSFRLFVDAMEQIDELDETNNSLTIDRYIIATDLVAALPTQFGLVASPPQAFKAITSDMQLVQHNGLLQIDTTQLFNSPLLYTQAISYSGSVAEWVPNFDFITEQTYFWRVAKTDSDSEPNYSNSSFIIRNGLTGWEQSHFNQLIDNNFENIVIDTINRKFNFSTSPQTIQCRNIGSPNSSNYMQLGYTINSYNGYSSCGAVNALLLVVIDSTTLIPWQSDMMRMGHANYPHCSSRPYENYFIFYLNNLEAGLDSLVNMVEKHIPNGNYFMIYSFISGQFQQWHESAYEAFERWGASQIRNVDNSVPYIFFSQKGHPGVTEEVVGTSANDTIVFRRALETNYYFGSVTSPVIGPAQKWSYLEWQATTDIDEVAFVSLVAVNENGTETTLIDTIKTSTFDLSDIDAQQYNSIKLKFNSKDYLQRTPAQLQSWRVVYTPYTDLSINPKIAWQFVADTLCEGEKGMAVMAFENIGNQNSDSLLVHYWIQTNNHKIVDVAYKRLKPLQPNTYVIDTVYFNTIGLSKKNVFYAELNPKVGNPAHYDQPEQTHFNNILQKEFNLIYDTKNPLLDVTIDGRHIKDGEMVSATPTIEISVIDDNKYLSINNLSLFDVYIKDMQNGEEKRIKLEDNPNVVFVPTDENGNRVKIIIKQNFANGTYQLRVRVCDASKNQSGDTDYTITFSVANESCITNIFAYPNPFSSATHFAINITGEQLPDDLQITIFSSSGVPVKTITRSQFATLHIGENPAAYTWNGTNSHGALLPNGLYFYKVTATLNGKSLPIRMNQNGRITTNNVGRIVIIR